MSRSDSAANPSRRALLQAAAGSVALAALPALAASRGTARAASTTAPLGYWQGGAAAPPAQLRAGWLPPCAASHRHACAHPLHEELVDATRVHGSAGDFRVRIVALANGHRVEAMRLVAMHGEAGHEMWSTWRGGCSSPVAARMVSPAGAALSLQVVDEPHGVRDVQLPSRAGAYVLALDSSRVSWRGLGLAATDASRPLARELVRRGDGVRVAAPYLLLTVERLA
ncbi:MAG TPA: hypothetical protein VFL14_04525 [Xanthomonadales bacterium]|nr:hypothetical protein [Xanthomonadales bacterium]